MATWHHEFQQLNGSPDARMSFSVGSSIATRALPAQQKTRTLAASLRTHISLTCLGTAVQERLVWPGEAGCTWPPGTGLQSFLLLAAHSAEHHGQWLGSYGLYVLQQRRVVELAISGKKKKKKRKSEIANTTLLWCLNC